jgi:hypothetical protein
MKIGKFLLISIAIQLACLSAEPTIQREWTATSGHKTTARALSSTATTVTLELANGKTVPLALDKLVPDDRKFILDHFKIEAPKAGEPQRSGVARLSQEKAPHPLGQMTGPIQSAPGSNYHVYLPKSLKEGRKAPVLHFNGAGGYQAHIVNKFIPGVERFGWILIASVESKNSNSGDSNSKHAANNIAHIKETSLVADDRIYFTGHSGGGAMCWVNAAKLDGAGTLPVMSYIPQETNIDSGHHFVLVGTNDYNRYHSSRAAAQFKKDAFLRTYPGGHSYPSAQESHILDEGIAWLTAKYLDENTSNRELSGDRLDFEAAMIDWINELTPSNPHQAYHLTQMLAKNYRISGKNAEILSAIQSKLAAEPSHKSYHEGIEEIHEFGVGSFAGMAILGSVKGHNTKETAGKAERLARKYAGIPFVEETFNELAKPTVK